MSAKNVKWEWKKLKDICEKGSSSVKQGDLKGVNGDYPIYGASGFIQNVDFFQQSQEYIGIVKDGSGVGRTMLLPAKSSVIGTLQYILPKEGNSLKFINYALQNFDFSKLIQGAAIPHIYFKDYGEMNLAVPPIDEQKRIVKVLDETFEKIEKIKANAQANLQNAKDLFQTTIKASYLIETYNCARLGDVGYITDGDHLPPPKSKQGIPFITISNINKETNSICFDDTFYVPKSYFEELKDNRKPKIGDVLYTVTGSYGIPVLVDGKRNFCFQRHIGLIRPTEKLLPAYLFYWILSPDTKMMADEVATGAAQKTVSLKSLRDFPIPLPPLPIQKQIVAKLDALSEKVKQLESNYKQILADCEELKKAVLKKAFNGNL